MKLVFLFPFPDHGPKHTPLYITPVTKKATSHGHVSWSPYTAADRSAKLLHEVCDLMNRTQLDV